MEESGGRRIKSALNTDMKSVRFVDDDLRSRLKKINLFNSLLSEINCNSICLMGIHHTA